MSYTIKDSGEHRSYETGAKRDVNEGKGAYELLNPMVIDRDAKHYENGAKKYAARNWEQGIPDARYMQGLLRHAFQYLMGMRDEDHLAAVRFNAGGIMYNEEMISRGLLSPDLHDLPNYLPDDSAGVGVDLRGDPPTAVPGVPDVLSAKV